VAHICVLVTGQGVEEGDLILSGVARVGPDSESIPWTAAVAWDAGMPTVNDACVSSAITAARDLGHIINPEDNKILLGGASNS
jgi:hypothetical protein